MVDEPDLLQPVTETVHETLPLIPKKRPQAKDGRKPFEELALLKIELVKEQLALNALKRQHVVEEHELRLKLMKEEHEWKRLKFFDL